MSSCSYCRGPLTGNGHSGRPWPGRSPAAYCCFGCLSLGEQRQQEAAAPVPAAGWKLDGLGVRLGIGILVVAQSMIFGLALNLHDDVPPAVREWVQTLILAATCVVITLLGGPLFRAAARELRRGRLTLEALFLLTMAGAMAASLQAHFTGRGKIYFEVVSVLLVVYTLGKVIGSRSRAIALASSRAWAEQLTTCRLVDERSRMRVVPVAAILAGDMIEVSPGETIAVDGIIRAGLGFVSEAPVSGEPFAVVRRAGDRVLAGTASYDASFRIEATVKGTERQVDRLLAAVEQARDRPVSFQGQADRLGQLFFPLIVLTALGTFGYWTFLTSEGWEAGLFNAMSVLLVACPCALGLATPIVIWSALGRLAERGLIVRAGDAIERLAEVDRVMLDKTGTLTDESYALLDIATLAQGEARAEVLGWLALIQERSRHPIAKPFARLPRPFAPGEEPHLVSLQLVPGCGVAAELETVGGVRHRLRIGTPEWVSGAQSLQKELTAQLRARGHLVHVAVDEELAAIAVLAEQLRDSAAQTLEGFAQLGLKVEVLTGDTMERAAALNLPALRGGLLPSDKRAAIETARAEGTRSLFVGEGINDAAALAAAHAGIALASGTDIAIGAATMTLYHDDLRVLPWAIALSREAVRTVRRNLARALLYNLVGMTLAACGILHPVVAVLLMVASSLMLVFSSSRVGTGPTHCLPETAPRVRPRRRPLQLNLSSMQQAIGHGITLALQGVVVLLLLESAREWPVAQVVLGLFAILGLALGVLWQRWAAMPHTLEMCIGMLTWGNLGMLLGWWLDNGCVPLPEGGCCLCVAAMRQGSLQPWMWLGMLALANVAMVWFIRCEAVPGRNHTLAMYTGGNLGMLLGMLGGGWGAAQIPADTVALAVSVSFVGMTMGMIAGMLLGTWLVETVIGAVQMLPALPRWFHVSARDTAA
jgi:heavy metal translocating P-type ATPase